jgi:hypothetical protein
VALIGSSAALAAWALAFACIQPAVAGQADVGSGPAGHRKIALIPVGLPQRPTLMIIKSINDYLGIFGIATELRKQLAASKELSAELAEGGLDYRTYVPAQLEAALKAADVDVVAVPGQRTAGENFRFLSHPPAGADDAALLDVYVEYLGYTAEDSHTPYRPLVQLRARLSRPGSKFETRVDCGKSAALKDVATVNVDQRFSFADRQALKSASAEVALGLRSAIDAVAAELARQVKDHQ